MALGKLVKEAGYRQGYLEGDAEDWQNLDGEDFEFSIPRLNFNGRA